jgi:hypothetical protein
MVNLRLTLEFAVLSWVIETAARFGASYDELRSGAVKSCQAKWSDAFIQRVFRSVSAVSLWTEKFGCEFRERAPR